jgi:hypothetical protein
MAICRQSFDALRVQTDIEQLKDIAADREAIPLGRDGVQCPV